MISMYAEYSGRTLYVALSSDTIDGAKNGDTLYEMDTGKRYVYNESNDAWDEQPEEGGGESYGFNLRLLGSGTYTQLSNSTRNILIPTELGQFTNKILFTVESVDKTTMTGTRMGAWYRMYHVEDYFNPEVFPNPCETMYITNGGVKQWKARTSNNVNYPIWATADPGIGVAPVGSGDTIYAGEYIWKVWGV